MRGVLCSLLGPHRPSRVWFSGAKGRRWMMLEKQTIRHAPNASRACRLVSFSLSPVSYFSHSSSIPLSRFSTGRFKCLCTYYLPRNRKILQLTRSWITMINALSKKVMLKYIIGSVLIYSWESISFVYSEVIETIHRTLLTKPHCIIIGHRSLSSASRVSSYIKPQTSLMNDLPKVSGIGEIPGESCICTDGIRA